MSHNHLKIQFNGVANFCLCYPMLEMKNNCTYEMLTRKFAFWISGWVQDRQKFTIGFLICNKDKTKHLLTSIKYKFRFQGGHSFLWKTKEINIKSMKINPIGITATSNALSISGLVLR